MKHEIVSILFNDFEHADLSEIIECKEITNSIVDAIIEKLDERILYWKGVMNDSRIQTSGYKIAKARMETLEEIKKMLDADHEKL